MNFKFNINYWLVRHMYYGSTFLIYIDISIMLKYTHMVFIWGWE